MEQLYARSRADKGEKFDLNMIIITLIAAAVLSAVILFIIWQKKVLSRFIITEYSISSEKPVEALGIAVLSDLHGKEYGENNCELLDAVRSLSPDLILIPGDFIVYGKPKTYPVALSIVRELCTIAPVFFSNGNHEMKTEVPGGACAAEYKKIKKKMKKAGAVFLNNASQSFELKGNNIMLFGLDLPKRYYRRFYNGGLKEEELFGFIKDKPSDTLYNILLAHDPQFGDTYAKAGFDLTLCGHYHGGLICLPKIGSIISPAFHLFPRFAFGDSIVEGGHVITSRGLGTHRYNVRINNPAELIFIRVNGR